MKPKPLSKQIQVRVSPTVYEEWHHAAATSNASNLSDWVRAQITANATYRIEDAGMIDMLVNRALFQGQADIAHWLKLNTQGKARETGIVKRRKKNIATESKPNVFDAKIRRDIRGAFTNLNQIAYFFNSSPYIAATLHADNILEELQAIEESLRRIERSVISIESRG